MKTMKMRAVLTSSLADNNMNIKFAFLIAKTRLPGTEGRLFLRHWAADEGEIRWQENS